MQNFMTYNNLIDGVSNSQLHFTAYGLIDYINVVESVYIKMKVEIRYHI
jgi:hypothetical protein